MKLLTLLLLMAPIASHAAEHVKAIQNTSDVLAGVLLAVLVSGMIAVFALAIFRGRERPAAPDKHGLADGGRPPKKEPPRDP